MNNPGESLGGDSQPTPNAWGQFDNVSSSFEDVINEQKEQEEAQEKSVEAAPNPEREKAQETGEKTTEAIEAEYKERAAETNRLREKYDALYIESKKLGEKREGLEVELEEVKKELDAKRAEAFQAYDEYRAALAKEAEYGKDLMPETAPSNEEVELTIEKARSNKGMAKNKVLMIIAAVAASAAVLATATSVIRNHNANKTFDDSKEVIDLNRPGQENAAEENEAEKDWKELTGIDEFDKTVDGTFDQSNDIGMNGTDTKSEANPYGKFSDNSMAAPNTLMHEYFGITMEDAEPMQKALGVEMAAYKQAETAAAILTQVKAKGFEGMDYIRAVEKIKNASEEERSEYQDMLKNIFENSKVGETSVGEIRQALKVAGQDETLADWHYYMNRATGKAELRNIPTGAETKVLSFTYSETETTETTFYFLERCYNGFEVRKVVNTTTQETTYEVVVYEYKDDDTIPGKNYENMERIDEQNQKDIAKGIGGEDVDVHEDTAKEKTEKPTGDVYGEIEPSIVQNEQVPDATPVQPTAPENDYSQDKGEHSGPAEDNPTAQEKANSEEIPIEEAATPKEAAAEFGFN